MGLTLNQCQKLSRQIIWNNPTYAITLIKLPRELGDAPDIRCGDAPDIAEVGEFPCCFDAPLAFLLCILSCSFAQRAEFALLDPTAPTDITFSFFPTLH